MQLIHQISNKKAVLFDLDGTLIDSAPDIAYAVNEALSLCGLNSFDLSTTRGWIGKGADILLDRALDANGINDSKQQFNKLKAHFYDVYSTMNGDFSTLYPGVYETLDYFKSSGVKLACVTNKPSLFSGSLLALKGIDQFFELVISGDDVSNKKPDPEMLLTAAEQLSVSRDECLMVGDSDNDVFAAHNANMTICAVSYGYAQGVDLQALDIHYWVDSLTDLIPKE